MGTTTADTARHAALGRSEPGASRVDPHRPLPAPREDCPPRCPSCGGLDCLCRPRFFAGQLLTDEDLTRLERYVVAKNKLAQPLPPRLGRRLRDGGRVRSLRADERDRADRLRALAVRRGHRRLRQPVGERLRGGPDQRLPRRPHAGECDPPYDRPPRECDDGIERWVLAICYDERASRGVTALRGEFGRRVLHGLRVRRLGHLRLRWRMARRDGSAAPPRRPKREHGRSASRRSRARATASRRTPRGGAGAARPRRRSTTATTSSRSVPLSSPRCRINGVLSSPG